MNPNLIPLIVSSIFVIGITALCFFKPNAGRIFLGFFYLTMSIGVNGSFTLNNPNAYVDYAQGALIPFYRNLTASIVSINPFLFGLLLMVFEICMGLLILHRGKAVKVGLIGTMLFVIGMAPLSWLQLPWLGLVIAEIHLFRKDFEKSLIDMLFRRNQVKQL